MNESDSGGRSEPCWNDSVFSRTIEVTRSQEAAGSVNDPAYCYDTNSLAHSA